MKPEALERMRRVKLASQIVRAGTWRAAEAPDHVAIEAAEIAIWALHGRNSC